MHFSAEVLSLLTLGTMVAAQGAAWTNRWGYIGCYPYSFTGSITTAGPNVTTINECATYCDSLQGNPFGPYYYFGVSTPLGNFTQGGEFCICTSSPSSLSPMDNGLCNSTCPGHTAKRPPYCGGSNGADYFYLSMFASV
ncbi:hypothetical protein N7520_006558 [Penicillium odoratum]|uniref:uncharacterized protein n=1 Tax=Penicillium odoratum TaxID=1167516 RepID=UPI0025486534|nr:uncharacterized protein N7520_006558 [Penicillium odoratum]KAJ5759402.1 hypothetical protein N7520_006558 [Penicillium odoratum]